MTESAYANSAPIAHKVEGSDPYAWLQNRDSKEVLDYLIAENNYQEAQLADQAEFHALAEHGFARIYLKHLGIGADAHLVFLLNAV